MTAEELTERQHWPLEHKIDHALATIDAFVGRLGGLDKVYLSFSGGKDSTVLLHLARVLFPDILAVFCNTGNEYPSIIQFVRQTQRGGVNLQIIRPKLTPRQVWAQYGFPLVSKESSEKILRIRHNPNSNTAKRWLGDGYFALPKKWRFLIDEPFETSNRCCDKLKKEPMHRFEKETGRKPILGIMADESKMRRGLYIRNGGCNVWGENPSSRPLSIWTEKDVWAYIDRYNLPIAEIYHKGATRTGCMGCGFGAQFADDTRFEILHQAHPKCYEMIMNYTNNGTTF
ncbi:MAG: phosphoadenosine phosphosulfate reductase family protein, partial [Lachnospiraceae bacterium]|nr:phosphoadenosine phosphosulfate reductase family protein [Lachnospiraceae bacterium]